MDIHHPAKMNDLLRILVFACAVGGWGYEDRLTAQIAAQDTPPHTTILPSLPREPADERETVNKMRDFFNKLIGPSHRLDKITEQALTDEYKDLAEAATPAWQPKLTVTAAVRLDFNYYTILRVDRIIVRRGVAFVQATVRYDALKLHDLRREEKDNDKSGSDVGITWGSGGGTSSDNHFEKDSVGLATYSFVMQHGTPKLHFTYFSLKPIPDDKLYDAYRELEKTSK